MASMLNQILLGFTSISTSWAGVRRSASVENLATSSAKKYKPKAFDPSQSIPADSKIGRQASPWAGVIRWLRARFPSPKLVSESPPLPERWL